MIHKVSYWGCIGYEVVKKFTTIFNNHMSMEFITNSTIPSCDLNLHHIGKIRSYIDNTSWTLIY